MILLFYSLSFPAPQGEAEDRPAGAADDVGELGDVIRLRNAVGNLPADVDDIDQDEGQGNPPLLTPGEGGEDNQHEHNTAGSQQGGAREADKLHQAGD